jgi:hypothetical protein
MILLRIVTGMLTDHLVVTYCTVYKASRYRPGAEMGPYSKYANVQVFNFMHVLMISRCFAFCIFFSSNLQLLVCVNILNILVGVPLR